MSYVTAKEKGASSRRTGVCFEEIGPELAGTRGEERKGMPKEWERVGDKRWRGSLCQSGRGGVVG